MNGTRTPKTWRDFRPAKRRALSLAAVVQVALLIAVQLDLSRRPAVQVRGKKWWWRLAAFVNFVGPLAYFLLGRRPVPVAASTV